jgi:hypothetical protein
VPRKTLSTFQVIAGDGSICGSINVLPGQEQDLLAHWSGPKDIAPQQGSAAAMVARLKPTRVSRAAILRGS